MLIRVVIAFIVGAVIMLAGYGMGVQASKHACDMAFKALEMTEQRLDELKSMLEEEYGKVFEDPDE